MDHLARRSRKTEANREKERESQDEPIDDKSNAHGARGEILRGLVRSRVGHHYVDSGFQPKSHPSSLWASGLADRASIERDLGTLSAGFSCHWTCIGDLQRDYRRCDLPRGSYRCDARRRFPEIRSVTASNRPRGQVNPCNSVTGELKKIANGLSTWNRARSPAELKHIIERRKRKPKGIPPVMANEKGRAKRRTRDPNGSVGM